MNSKIDERIRETLHNYKASVTGRSPGLLITEDEAIAAIQKAIEEEGYLSPDKVKKVQELVNQMASHAQDLAKLPVTVIEPNTMIGQEWFDAFERELNMPDNRLYFNKSRILEAAKRASGLTQEDGNEN